jgi:hypothetical protein
MSTLHRRRLLQGAGLASGTLFLPSLIGDRAAYAQGPARRLVVFDTPHGPVTGRWELRPTGMPATPQAEWELPLGPVAAADFSETLRPLHAIRDDVLILEGLAMTSAIADKQGNNHGVATGHRMTGAMEGTRRVSFDQYAADALAVPGRFKYLGFTGAGGDTTNAGYYDTAGNGVTLTRMDSYYGFLANQFERVFGSVGMTPAPPAGPLGGAALSRSRRQASIAFVRGQYEKLFTRLGSEDRAKLSRHRDMLDDLGKRVSEVAQIQCGKPSYPPKGTSLRDHEIGTVVLTKMFPAAMACDLTRVGLFSHKQLAPADVGAPAGLDWHQDVAHSSSAEAQSWTAKAYALHARQFADMVAAFKSVPEGNGTMLDNTVLLWSAELANGGHDLYRMMYVVAGGRNLGLRPGRYLKYAETGPNPYNLLKTSPYGDAPKGNYGSTSFGLGPAHNRLLISVLRALGVDRNAIGLDAAVGTGYLRGAKVELTGPLPRLAV